MANLSANRRISGRPGQAARCGGSKKEQATLRAAGFTADGFLKHRFLPLYQQGERIPGKKQVEKGFFQSLSNLADYHPIQPIQVAGKPYPYNILLAHWDVKQQLKRFNKDMEVTIVTDERNRVMLSTKETVNTGATLFYIPVLPLYRLLQDRRQKKCAELLLSVFAYLCHIAAIPYYRDADSYLFYHYEMLEEWVAEDPDGRDEQDYLHDRSVLRKAAYFGDVMQRKIYNPCQLNHFEERINSFVPVNPFQYDCLKIAQAALNIWQQYPDHTLFQHIDNGNIADEETENEQEESIRISEYVSFIAENEGSLYDSLSEMVNSEFNERGYIQEPIITKLYDQSDQQGDSLDFEQRLFDLVTDLCTLLNDLP